MYHSFRKPIRILSYPWGKIAGIEIHKGKAWLIDEYGRDIGRLFRYRHG